MMLTECYGGLSCNIFFTAVIQYVQYVSSSMRTNREWSPTHRADQSTIFYACCPIKRSPTQTEYQTENKIQVISATHERDECLRPHVIQMLERRRHKDEDARSVQPLMIQYSQCSGPAAVAPLHPQLQPALRLHDWLGTSGAHLHPGEGNGLVLFVPTLMAPTCGVCVNCVRFFFFFLCIYLSVWLLEEEERDGKVIWRCKELYGAWAGAAVPGSGWCMETTPEDLNLGRWRPNLFSTPAKVAAARR